MQDTAPNGRNFITIALIVEGSLALVALALGSFFKQPPLETIRIDGDGLVKLGWASLIGLVAALPLLAGLWLSDRIASPIRSVSEKVDELIVPLFRGATAVDLLAISVAAGLGEEMLFRGWLQSWVVSRAGEPYGTYIGLAVASVIFGLCHLVTPMYGLLAGLIGVYFGWLLIVTENLAAPIVCHAAYDFVALLYYCRWRKRG